MVKFYKEVYNLKYDDGSTIGFFSKLDTDKNGKISKTEFQFYEASSQILERSRPAKY